MMQDGTHHHGGGNSAESGSGHAKMLRKWIWRDFIIITLGVWLLMSPGTMGYWESDPRTAWSDVACGALTVIGGVLILWPRFDLVRWVICAIGGWLLFAPLVFWTTSAAAYNNGTLIGSLLIAFSVLIPMMPSKTHHRVMTGPGPDVPPGWTYNPSDWLQRGPLIAMALVGFFLSRYLAAYQLGHTRMVWDPFFEDGTRRVLESEVSRAWPISDAGLGAVSYMLEALSGFMGATNRWRTMPWMVVMFGVLVVPLGIVSIMLIILQPVAVGAWCTVCLITAVAMVIMISPAIDEVVAMCQFLIAAKREGQPFWRTLWVGGTVKAWEDRPQTVHRPERSIARQLMEAVELSNVPWNMLVSAGIGVWLMFAPAAFGFSGRLADSDHLVGALVVTFSVIAFGEIIRPIRFMNALFGAWLIAAPWIFEASEAARWSDMACGAALIALSIRRGSITEKFAGWNRYLV